MLTRGPARGACGSCVFAVALFTAACGTDPTVVSKTDVDASAALPEPDTRADAGASDEPRDAEAQSVVDAGRTPISSPAPTGPSSRCVNLQCRQHACADGGATTISGTVYDPAGNNPLYNVAVYVPNAEPAPLPPAASCDRCDSLYTGSPIAATLTDPVGKFRLENAPVGENVPLVVQIGKWRRQFKIANVAECADNPQPEGTLRLPRNRGEGDIPRIAISTGGADTLECLLRRVGVDASEYVPGAGGEGRVHIFRGNGEGDSAPDTSPAAPSSASALWSSSANLLAYDIVLLSCEGDETEDMNQQALHDYASAGGRVFASHYHYAWFNTGPYSSENLATWSPGGNEIDDTMGTIVTTLPNGQPFPKGQALATWLGRVGALQGGKLPIEEAKHNADVSAANTPSQAWILADQSSEAPGAAQYFSFNTPTDLPDFVADGEAPDYCGRVVYSDLHVGAASNDDPEEPVPSGCENRVLSPQEAALEFMLFDLSSCIVPDELPPEPPPVPPLI